MSVKDKFVALQQALKLHVDWFVSSILGEGVLSKESLEALDKYKALPTRTEGNFAETSYVLGRLKAVLKQSEYRDLNYEEVKEKLAKSSFTPLEKLAIEQAKLHAGENLKGLADDVLSGVFSQLSESLEEAVTEASIKGIIKDTTALSMLEKESYQKLSSRLYETLKTDWEKDWHRVAETELHGAKTRGVAQAIINKVDLYAGSDGPDSYVSIVPNPEKCKDCGTHYLDPSGNPRVFKLKDLLTKGSNADSGVKHNRGKDGIHVGWKTTLPPLHPRCGCALVYIPPGMGWVSGKLKVTDMQAYGEALEKAVSPKPTATITPPGPKSAVTPESKPASIPGLPAPGNVAGPGRPSSSATDGPTETTVPCPFGGGDSCKSAGGNGAKTHKSGGSIMKKHQEAMMRGNKPQTTSGEDQYGDLMNEKAKNWSKGDHAHATVLSHLSTGSIAHSDTLGKEDGGGSMESHRVVIDGNGRGLAKPTPKYSDNTMQGRTMATGAGIVPLGSGPSREVAAYALSNSLGLQGHVPPTTSRVHIGKNMSVQQWKEGTAPLGNHLDSFQAKYTNTVKTLLDSAPADKRDFLKNKLQEIITLDLIMNNTDRHSNNIVAEEDLSDIHCIDHGFSFGNSMSGQASIPFRDMHRAHMKVTVPPALKTRMENTSLGDLKRSVGQHLEDYEVGQTFLRMKYVLHLQDTEGRLDFEKLGRATISNIGGNKHASHPHHAISKDSYKQRTQDKTRPQDIFDSWAKNYLQEASADSSHPDHASAKELTELGVFMGPNSHKYQGSSKHYREAGVHKDFEKTIIPRKTMPKLNSERNMKYSSSTISEDERRT